MNINSFGFIVDSQLNVEQKSTETDLEKTVNTGVDVGGVVMPCVSATVPLDEFFKRNWVSLLDVGQVTLIDDLLRKLCEYTTNIEYRYSLHHDSVAISSPVE